MIRINLAPADRRPVTGGPKFTLPSLPELDLATLFIVLYIATGAGLGIWWWQTLSYETRLATKLKQTKDELEVLKQQVGQASKIRDQVTELRKRIEAINELTKAQARPVKLFDALADVIPRDLWLTGLEERGDTLRIIGTSYSTTAVADFMANLRQSGRFKDVDIVVSRQDIAKPPRLVTFEVTCRFES
jgi:Tfp pilus assembly protein PilN